jgi:hypothetical protein
MDFLRYLRIFFICLNLLFNLTFNKDIMPSHIIKEYLMTFTKRKSSNQFYGKYQCGNSHNFVSFSHLLYTNRVDIFNYLNHHNNKFLICLNNTNPLNSNLNLNAEDRTHLDELQKFGITFFNGFSKISLMIC